MWLKVWIAAADDPALYDRLAAIEPGLAAAVAATAADLTPPGIEARDWTRRITVALDTLRGLALRTAIEPRQSSSSRNPWLATRTELARLLRP
ncbi:hypothetical protein [Nocardia arthritidis]|uniref:BetI-type transcriptional repressor C-terminal domain-containing protein n=1 Tax=Nocardia arthritidis TaxID=228602 RepID=A0A6G9YHM5_9NOCA|nr:hypothetical protein [Nocardia arthritidis]QIS12749.1 hypothetical protein F5544_24470 [Nocardia arthritidis]